MQKHARVSEVMYDITEWKLEQHDIRSSYSIDVSVQRAIRMEYRVLEYRRYSLLYAVSFQSVFDDERQSFVVRSLESTCHGSIKDFQPFPYRAIPPHSFRQRNIESLVGDSRRE